MLLLLILALLINQAKCHAQVLDVKQNQMSWGAVSRQCKCFLSILLGHKSKRAQLPSAKNKQFMFVFLSLFPAPALENLCGWINPATKWRLLFCIYQLLLRRSSIWLDPNLFHHLSNNKLKLLPMSNQVFQVQAQVKRRIIKGVHPVLAMKTNSEL